MTRVNVERPTCRQTLIPFSPGMSGAWVMTCELCGAMTMDQPLHDAWHAEATR